MKPKLEVCLIVIRQDRLDEERFERVLLRRDEVTGHMSLLAVDANLRAGYGRFGVENWKESFPFGWDLFTLPSIRQLLADDETPVMSTVWDAQEDKILLDVARYKVRCVSVLSEKLEKLEREILFPDPRADSSDSDVAEENVAPPLLFEETPTVSKERHLALLARATSIFEPERYTCGRGGSWLESYPSILFAGRESNPNSLSPATSTLAAIHARKDIQTMAFTLLRLLGLSPSSTHRDLRDMGKVFLCQSCIGSPPMGWLELVRITLSMSSILI